MILHEAAAQFLLDFILLITQMKQFPYNMFLQLIIHVEVADKRNPANLSLNGIVSRDFVVCFLVSFDRSYISTHPEWVLLLLKVRFRIEFFDFRVWAW
jgi:hypothetical protein